MAEAKIEIRAEGGAQTASEISKGTAAAEKLLARQQKIDQDMKWDKAIDSIGRLASKFSGFTQEAIDGVEKVAKGFLVGGPLLGGLAAVIEVTGLITKKLEEQDAAWKAEHEAAVKAADAQQQALKAVAAETQQLALEERALTIARKDGVSISVARAQAEKESIVLTREEGVAKMATLRSQLKEQNDIIIENQQALDEELRTRNRREFSMDIVLARQKATADVAAAKERKAAIEAQQTELDNAMLGSAQRVRNAEKKIAIERQSERQKARGTGEKSDDLTGPFARELAAFEQQQDEWGDIFKDHVDREVEIARIAEERKKSFRDARIDAMRASDKFAEDQAFAAMEANQNKVEKLNKRLSDEKAKDDENKKKAGEAFANAGLAGVDALKALATGQQEFTKAALDERAKQAGIEALFNAGLALAALGTAALGNPQGLAAAAAYGASAAQFAAIAGVSKAASAAAPSAAPAQASGGSASSGSGRSSGGGGGTTVIINGRALMTDRDVARSVAQATRAAARYA